MRRRDVLAGVGALGVFGAGAAFALGDVDLLGDGEGVEPVELPQLEAPGSSAGTVVVPEEGRVSYVTFFATWCTTCRAKMGPLGEAATAVENAQFISVTNEAVGQAVQPEDVADWWRRYDGNWPVAHDDELELSRRLEAPGVPYSVVLDADNRVTWSDAGYKEATEILEQIDAAR